MAFRPMGRIETEHGLAICGECFPRLWDGIITDPEEMDLDELWIDYGGEG